MIYRLAKVSFCSMFKSVRPCWFLMIQNFSNESQTLPTIDNDFPFRAVIPPNPVVWDSSKTATNRHFVWNFPLHGVNMCSWFVLFCNTMKCAQLVCTVLNTMRFYLYFTVTQWGWFVLYCNTVRLICTTGLWGPAGVKMEPCLRSTSWVSVILV